ncbi:hypothetical protein J6590_078233 [Homalodisca vitripennis]|nr:hypothetical protein J6590_078233 [Homalodisca vitripennis]
MEPMEMAQTYQKTVWIPDRKKGTAQDVSSSHDYYHTTLQHRRRWDTDKKINVGTSCGLATGCLRMTSIKRIAISVREERIYVIGSVDDTRTMHLLSTDYEATKVNHLFSGSELEDPKGLDIFYDQVVWLRLWNSRIHLYKCRLTPKCNPVDVTMINHYPTTLLGMRTYFPEKQTPSERYLCAQMRCSHSCKAASLFTAKCLCPEDMVIGNDNRTCLAERSKTLDFESELEIAQVRILSVTVALYISTINLVLYRLPLLFFLMRSAHRPVAHEDGQSKA